ncbi:hypothetical protein NST28_31435 [Paenibacillus sp. FSL R10-2791]|uniref:hypothetical protein n=1 Tax=unclassified Paenibacillus TaxID=185978 RepID=UPI0030F7A6E2
MDHAIDSLSAFYEIALKRLYDEWATGKYIKLSDCPLYKECNTYRKAIKVMRDSYNGETSRGSVKEDLESEIWVTKGIEVKW